MAGAHEFLMSHQRNIIYYLSTLRMHNCIIVSQETYEKYREYNRQINLNDVDKGMNLRYTLGFHIRVQTVVLT